MIPGSDCPQGGRPHDPQGWGRNQARRGVKEMANMKTTGLKRWVLTTGTALVCSTCALGAWAGSQSTAPLVWISALPAMVPVAGSSSTVVRNESGVSVRVHTQDLVPGDAYTLWLVAFNYPENCGTPYACGDPDIGNPAVAADVMYTTGRIIGSTGMGNFAGHRAIGDNSGSIFLADGPLPPAEGLLNPMGAEIHLVVHSHGPKLSEYMPSMIQTFGGGCGEAVPPFPFHLVPEWGPLGPNTCESVQIGMHRVSP
jgi:hypothetical protein